LRREPFRGLHDLFIGVATGELRHHRPGATISSLGRPASDAWQLAHVAATARPLSGAVAWANAIPLAVTSADAKTAKP
jgi:hypothetical protein